MLTRLCTVLIAGLLLAIPSQLSAQLPGPVASNAAGYGPLMACIGNYAVQVHEGEAAHHIIVEAGRVEQIILIRNSARRVTFQTGAVETSNRQFDNDDVRLPSGVTATRYSFEQSEGYRAGIPGEVVWSSEPAHREYLLPGGEGGQPLIVLSDIFSDRDRHADEAVLSRLVPRSSVECATLEPAASPGASPSPAVFTPQIVVGPTTFCSGQLGIALREGERVRIVWPFDDRIAPIWVFQGGDVNMQLGGGPPINRPVPNGRFLDVGFTEWRFPDGSGGAWSSRSARYAFGDGSPMTIYISYLGTSQEHVDAVMNRLAFFRRGEGCTVQAMPVP